MSKNSKIGLILITCVVLVAFYPMPNIIKQLYKPAFNRGDCVRTDLSNEFETYTRDYLVLEVGKKMYKYMSVDHTCLDCGFERASNIDTFEYRTKKIECPDLAKETFERYNKL